MHENSNNQPSLPRMRSEAMAGIGPKECSTGEVVAGGETRRITRTGTYIDEVKLESELSKLLIKGWITQLAHQDGSRPDPDSPVNLFLERSLIRFLYTLESRIAWWEERRCLATGPGTVGDGWFSDYLDSLRHLLAHRDLLLFRAPSRRFLDVAAVLILGRREPLDWPDGEWTDDEIQVAHCATQELESLLALDACGADCFRPFATSPPPVATSHPPRGVEAARTP